ncbi:MAG TPA: Crp/Fnr family transcriptional regulator [Anaerolineaceae bacterium]|nr:Crp/Fnr family transcriptional regulator [Anaerolineaceae bacterium]
MVSFLPEKELDSGNCSLIVVRLTDITVLDHIQSLSKPWLAWCCGQNDELMTKAYAAGALAAFSAETPFPVIVQIIQRTLDKLPQKRDPGSQNAIQRRYQRGDVILLEPETVLEIQRGIIAQTMIYQDGTEVLLGLCGPNQLVVPHPADTCYIQLISHSDSLVTLKPWTAASQDPQFSEKLHARLMQLEAWASMQARPHLDQRVLGILSLLAEQFGVSHPQGQLVDVRITHSQLASAVGATRTTITRTLGDLRRQGSLTMVQTSDGERYCLTRWEPAHHGLRTECC